MPPRGKIMPEPGGKKQKKHAAARGNNHKSHARNNKPRNSTIRLPQAAYGHQPPKCIVQEEEGGKGRVVGGVGEGGRDWGCFVSRQAAACQARTLVEPAHVLGRLPVQGGRLGKGRRLGSE